MKDLKIVKESNRLVIIQEDKPISAKVKARVLLTYAKQLELKITREDIAKLVGRSRNWIETTVLSDWKPGEPIYMTD